MAIGGMVGAVIGAWWADKFGRSVFVTRLLGYILLPQGLCVTLFCHLDTTCKSTDQISMKTAPGLYNIFGQGRSDDVIKDYQRP